MTLTPLLQREIDEHTTRAARHAIAQELAVYRRVIRHERRWDAEHPTNAEQVKQVRLQSMESTRTAIRTLTDLAHSRFPRVHPAPGRLDWCLVNQHGPVCDNHAVPGSSYCHQHRAYEDYQRERIVWS